MANWPTSVSTDANLYIAVNSLQTTLSAPIDNVVTVIPLISTTNFPTAGGVTIDSEVIFYTGIAGLSLTGATRGSDGTTAASHNSGVPVGATIIAAHHNYLKNEIIAIESSLNFTPSLAIATNASGRLVTSATTSTELGFLSGVTSSVQIQLNGKASDSLVVHLAGTETITGDKNFTTPLALSAGSVTLPALYLGGDVDNGLYQSATDELSIANQGIQTIRFTADNRVGIGGAPDAINTKEMLHIESTSNAGASAVDIISYNNGTGTARVYAQAGSIAPVLVTYIVASAAGTPGSYWSGGPNNASTSAFQTENAATVVFNSLWTAPSPPGSTTYDFHTDQGSILFNFVSGSTVRATFNDGIWSLPDGSAAAPVYRFASDTSSHHNGMYKIGTDHLGFSTGDTLRFDLTTALATLALPLAMSSNKITGLANGTAATDAAAFGQIFTGFQAPVQTAVTTNTTSTSSTFTSTVVTATITPTSASHRIKITVVSAIFVAVTGKELNVTIAKGGTNLLGSRGLLEYTSMGANSFIPVSFTYIDSPATTSATTYAMQMRNTDNTTTLQAGDTNLTQIMILEEIV